jgi:hypothetical protein
MRGLYDSASPSMKNAKSAAPKPASLTRLPPERQRAVQWAMCCRGDADGRA